MAEVPEEVWDEPDTPCIEPDRYPRCGADQLCPAHHVNGIGSGADPRTGPSLERGWSFIGPPAPYDPRPRTWTIPAEPDVPALTDRAGRTWKREARGWVCHDPVMNINAVETWAVLFTTRWPLTEVDHG